MSFTTGLDMGASHSLMSYYVHGGADTIPCSHDKIIGNGATGLYDIRFDVGTVTGACVIVFEVGAATYNGSSNVLVPMPDKIRWEYTPPAGGSSTVYGSEYSAVHMGDGAATMSNSVANTMRGMGYMRGMIGGFKDSSNSIPLSAVVGTKLTATSVPTDVSTLGAGASTIPGFYPNFKASTASSNGVTHGTRSGLQVNEFISGVYAPNGSPSETLGPYTGHHITEVPDWEGKTYAGSSAVTLKNSSHATRQAMMVVPIIGGGEVKIMLEATFSGTWHQVQVNCPIVLPKWGNADRKAGVKQNGDPYVNATDAGRHNFADVESPTAGSLVGLNKTLYHLNSQNAEYRINTPNGGHVLDLAENASGGSPNNGYSALIYDGVVNTHDWVFSDPNGANRLVAGFYAIRIGSTNYVVEVGADSNSYTTGNSSTTVKVRGIVKAITTI